jgi:ankyrin repeat protein/DNA replication protein DnaC
MLYIVLKQPRTGQKKMPGIFFDANHISEHEIKDYQELIQAIVSGRLCSPQVKKLSGISYQNRVVYRAKIDAKYRLVFTYQLHEGKNTLLILSINNHNYKKLKRELIASGVSHTTFFNLEANESLPVIEGPTEEELTFLPTVAYKQKMLVLDESQQQARKESTPLLLSGPPGAGKTVMLYHIMLRNLINEDASNSSNQSAITPILFVSPSEHLIKSIKEEYQSTPQSKTTPVEFSTWQMLLQSHYKGQQPVKEGVFPQWLEQHALKEFSKIIHYEFSLIASLGGEKYLTLGKRQCYFSGNKEQQEHLITLLTLWKKYLLKEQLFDPMVTALSEKVRSLHPAIYCDETQNLPPIALDSLMKRAADGHFVACLDSEQCLISSPYIHNCMKGFFYQHYGDYTEHFLPRTWRCRPEIMKIANHLMNVKYTLDGGDKRRHYKEIKATRPDGGGVTWVDNKNLQALNVYATLAGTVVISEYLTAEERLFINKELGTYNILSAKEAIGLDYDNVILWNPFSQNDCLRQLKTKEDATELSLEQWNALNALYVSLTRAREHVFLYDKERTRWASLATQLLGEVSFNQNLNQAMTHNPEEEQKKWLHQVDYHVQEGSLQQARDIMRFHLKMGSDAVEEYINKASTASAIPTPGITNATSQNNRTVESQDKTKTKQQLATQPPPKARTTNALPKTPKPSGMTDKEKSDLKNILRRITSNDGSVIKNLLEKPNAERYLFEMVLSGLDSSLPDMSLFQWLTDKSHYNACLMSSLKSFFSALEKKHKKSTPSDSIINLLCRKQNELSLLSLIPHVIENDKKSLSFIKKIISADKLTEYLNAPINKETGATLVFDAAHRGHVTVIKILKGLGADVDQALYSGGTPVYVAAQQGHVEVIKALKILGADLNKPDSRGMTPAYVAAHQDNVPVLMALASLGADLDKPNNNKVTPAYIAAELGCIKALETLKSLGANLNNPDIFGATPAYIAAQKGNIKVLTTLHSLGANLNQPTYVGATPAHVAAQLGNVEVLKTLNSLGVDLGKHANNGITLNDGVTPVFAAAQNGHTATVAYLLKNTTCFKPCYCEIQVIRTMASRGGDKAIQRANELIQDKRQNDSEEQTIPLMWHEIAHVMGYEKIEQLFFEQCQSTEKQKLVATLGFFGEKDETIENNGDAASFLGMNG